MYQWCALAQCYSMVWCCSKYQWCALVSRFAWPFIRRATLAVVSHFVSSSTPANHHHHHHHFIQHGSELIFTSPKGLPSPLPCLLPFLPRACSSSHSSNFLPPSPPTQLLLPHPSSPTPLPHPTTPLGSHSLRPSSPPSCPYICLHLIPFPITILL